ncbi:MobV family relaxase, partial [Bacillus cereus]|uniref:MobV family relaxase n=15 Tax=Bacillus TaxID=1386 RepID=UPI002ABF39A0
MSYSIFRVQGIKTLSDLRGIGKHNAERVSYTNLDIDREKSKENIELIQCESYRNRFNEITKEMKADHDKRMETTRSDRRKTFEQALDTAKNDVACEFLFTSDQEFFEGKSKEEIQEWAETSLDFLRKDIGISEDRIIHASVHMDEKTPHLHVVAVPIIKAYDGRRKANTWQISRKKFIPTKDDLTRLQDIYNERMNEAGYNLERGTKKELKHATVHEFKERTEYHKTIADQEMIRVNRIKQKADSLLEDIKYVPSLDKIKIEKEMVLVDGQGLFGKLNKVEKETGRIVLGKEEYRQLISLAKTSEVLRRENKNFKKENEQLIEANHDLKASNAVLIKNYEEKKLECDFYKKRLNRAEKLIQAIHDYYKKYEEKSLVGFEIVKGFCKAQLNRMLVKTEKVRVNSSLLYQ